MYAQRDEKKAEQAAKEQLEKEKPGEKKVVEEPPRKKRRVQKFPSLTAQMKEDIQKGKWLTDEHIHLAQTLLRAQFPNINGLQCPLLSENDAFDTQPHEALQIHFVAGNHWVASSSFGQEVTVYDSKYSGKLHPSLTHQLALKCFQKKKMEPFPHKKVASIQTENAPFFPYVTLELFCTCHMPETYDDMVECEE